MKVFCCHRKHNIFFSIFRHGWGHVKRLMRNAFKCHMTDIKQIKISTYLGCRRGQSTGRGRAAGPRCSAPRTGSRTSRRHTSTSWPPTGAQQYGSDGSTVLDNYKGPNNDLHQVQGGPPLRAVQPQGEDQQHYRE